MFRIRTEARTLNNVATARCLRSRSTAEKALRSSRERRLKTERFISGGSASHPRGIWGVADVNGGNWRMAIGEGELVILILTGLQRQEYQARFRRLWPIIKGIEF